MSRKPDFLSEARTAAKGINEPYVAWTCLKRWAVDKGPAGMKAAMEVFLEQHGSRPESMAILPEIIRSASLLPSQERKDIIEFANRSFSAPKTQIVPQPGQRFSATHDRPVLSFTAPPSASRLDKANLKDFKPVQAIRHVPIPPPKEQSRHISHESFEPFLSAHKGHDIVSSLTDRISSHARDEAGPVSPARIKRARVRKMAKKRVKIRAQKRVKTRAKIRAKKKPARRAVRKPKKVSKRSRPSRQNKRKRSSR